MAVFVGHKGNVRIKRGHEAAFGALSAIVNPDDINLPLNRLSFDGAFENLLTGDRLDIETRDARKLICFAPSAWLNNQVNATVSFHVNVNAAGGLRFFRSFEAAVNNDRTQEVRLAAFIGAPLEVNVTIRDATYNVLGNVTGYTFNTDREAIDTTSLSDAFKKQYTAGLISGNGTIDCLFDYRSSGVKETPLLMLQLIQRLDIGSEFDLALYLTDSTSLAGVQNIFYEIAAVVTRTGITVQDNEIIACTIDFVSAGDIKLFIGEPAGYILREDEDRIGLEQSLGFILDTED